MRIEKKLALKITFAIFIFLVLFWILFSFLFSDYVSLKDFFINLVKKENISSKEAINFYTYLLLSIFVLLFWFYILSYFFIKKIFFWINENNDRLKDYNHYLAHELKTPISVIQSNLEVLAFWFDEEKILNSKNELKNIIKIIDGLLNFSESINISNKKNINVENFLKNYIYFLNKKENIFIINKEFNFSIETDETLFLRVIKNLIENAIKYSIDWKLNIYIKKDKLIFENNIFSTLSDTEIKNIFKKFYSRTYKPNNWNGLWLTMINEIVKVLWYKLKILSENNKFIVEIIY